MPCVSISEETLQKSTEIHPTLNHCAGPEGFAMSHSEMAEEEAAMRASTLANQALCPVYLGPLTSPAAAEVVAGKKARGAVLYADTSAAAVILDGEEYWNKCWRHAASFLCSPPLRE